jgi:Cof subfamily protein (haloacid dehalogenase superfamily)
MNTPTLQNIRLIATDIDGTLLDSDHRLSERFYPIYSALRERGILFAFASGRQFHNLYDRFSPVNEDALFVAENGNYIYHSGKELLVRRLEAECVRELVRSIHGIPEAFVVLCGKERAYVSSEEPRFVTELTKFYTQYETVPDLDEVAGNDILKVTICDLLGSETNSYPVLRHWDAHMKVKVSARTCLDISHMEGHKGSAISLIQQLNGISPEQTMVFGDYLNDLEMLNQAHFSYAMENAHPEVKATARFRAASNNDEGVIRVLEEVLAATTSSEAITQNKLVNG